MTRKSLFVKICCVLCLYENTTAVAFLSETIYDPDIFKNEVAFLSTPIYDPDKFKNVSELITSKGYPVEEHYVQTADGYLLSLQRIPHGRSSQMDTNKKDVVLLIHGLLSDASVWVFNFPDQSLGFVLPDAGYDVWLLNNRGNRYSRKHVKYSTHQYKFWNFSFDELAQYDVPNSIDYILNVTGQEDLCIIGGSQGTTVVFAMLSAMPDYNDKVKLFIAMAPVAWIGYTPSSARYLVPIAEELELYSRIITHGECLPDYMFSIFRKICLTRVEEICEEFAFTSVGENSGQLNQTRFGVYLEHFPSSTSTKSLIHYAQEIKSFKFRKYNYGRSLNLQYYHQEEPPEYNVSRITTPVALFWSTNDFLADPTDVAILRKNLKSIVFDYCVPYPYNHLDFFVAMNAPQFVNKPLLQLLSRY